MSNLIVPASATALPSRRGFLSGLAGLPLIGGGVAILGAPTAAATPVTRGLLERYHAWIANEHAAVLFELGAVSPRDPAQPWAERRICTPLHWFPDAPDVERSVLAMPPSSRAAVVLSAVGCGLGGDHA